MSAGLGFSPEIEAQLRRQVREQLAAAIPAEHVDVVCDLAFHATRSAMDAIDRVCSSSFDHRHFIAAIGPAVALVASRCQQVQEGLKSFAAEQGLPYFEHHATAGGGQ